MWVHRTQGVCCLLEKKVSLYHTSIVVDLHNSAAFFFVLYGMISRCSCAQGMEVINDPNVQAVWVCSPSQFHADQIKAAAKAGKHIFCEKPIATDLKGTIEAVQARFLWA